MFERRDESPFSLRRASLRYRAMMQIMGFVKRGPFVTGVIARRSNDDRNGA
jgi:hypothetical protein